MKKLFTVLVALFLLLSNCLLLNVSFAGTEKISPDQKAIASHPLRGNGMRFTPTKDK